jgi:hypothetical protein
MPAMDALQNRLKSDSGRYGSGSSSNFKPPLVDKPLNNNSPEILPEGGPKSLVDDPHTPPVNQKIADEEDLSDEEEEDDEDDDEYDQPTIYQPDQQQYADELDPHSDSHKQQSPSDQLKIEAERLAVKQVYRWSWTLAPLLFVNVWFWDLFIIYELFAKDKDSRLLVKWEKNGNIIATLLVIIIMTILMVVIMRELCVSSFGLGAKVAGYLSGVDTSFCEAFNNTN